jgi:hypothetical protein
MASIPVTGKETPWPKIISKGTCNTVVRNCVEKIYDTIKFRVRCGEHELTDFVHQRRAMR